MQNKLTDKSVHGTFRVYHVNDGVSKLVLCRKNIVLYDWGTIVSKLLAGDSSYNIRSVYAEYGNVGVSAAVSTAAPTRDSGLAYFTALEGDANRDYFRLPAAAVTTFKADGALTEGNNAIRVFAVVTGDTGTNGVSYTTGPTTVSKLCGAALVATPDLNDRTKDVCFSRVVLTGDEQLAKPGSGQLHIAWDISLD